MERTRIDEIMHRQLVTVPPDCPVAEAVRIIGLERTSSVVVCEGRSPVGVVSERDLVMVLSDLLEGRLEEPLPTVAEIMVSPVWTVHTDDDVEQVATIVEERGFRRVPVVDDAGEIVGIVRFTDLVGFHAEVLKEQRADLEAAVQRRTAELTAANERLRTLSRRDGLLDIGNRRAMDEALDDVHALALRYRRPYAVALLDVDHFKAYNDRYGHPRADEVLRTIADRIKTELRGSDHLYRYGGEELLALLPETTGDGARIAAERLRATVEELGEPHDGSAFGLVTVSCGVVTVDPAAGTLPDAWAGIVAQADAALYRAKEGGRNRVEAIAWDRAAAELVPATG